MNKYVWTVLLVAWPWMNYAQTDTLKDETLQEITIYGNSTERQVQMKSAQPVVDISQQFIETHLGGSLMQSLSFIPGVKAMTIGSGESKPAIRGLGFNRTAVTENGIKHEGQQWGEDHGLEISQMDIDRIEIIKGPSALLVGSDAIGGVINIYSNDIPERKLEGKVKTFYHSNNASVGGALRLGGIGEKGFYWKAAFSGNSYGDYRVPTDSIQYYSYYIQLKDGRLRNTAGHELDGSVMVGYQGKNLSSSLRISNTNGKSGFFANAHGLEVRLSDIDYDAHRRDVDLPFHRVNHLKVMNHTDWRIASWRMSSDLSFQNNVREEQSEPVSHGYMPQPDNALERRFNKNTYTVLVSAKKMIANNHTLNIGTSMEHQHNKRDGWGFIIPDFRNLTTGLYVHDRWYINQQLSLSGGVRYDWTRTHIYPYQDWYETLGEYKQRSEDRILTFNSVTWSIGANYNAEKWSVKSNIGKGFRTPIPKELGTDGVNYHIFRYEVGNADLDPEESYQLDANFCWTGTRLTVKVDPFLNYFSNYIYMNPTSEYYEGLQVYNYTQAKVVRWGVEVQATYKWIKQLESELTGEYLYARLASGNKKGYTLPFSQPWNVSFTTTYKPWEESFLSVTGQYTGKQTEIVPPEKPTDGYFLLNASLGHCFHFKGKEHQALSLSLQAQNLLNRRYYDHTSYYRLIGVPEAGRNFSLTASYNF